jgi:uncharacterized protein YjbI with pentapeptide repeats
MFVWVLAALALAWLSTMGLGCNQNWTWTGCPAYIDPTGEYHPSKTLWDLTELLIIPAVLAIGGFLFNQAERRAEHEAAERGAEAERQTADRRADAEREIADERLREASLQAYLDRMTELLLEKSLRASSEDDEVRVVARARTLTVLRQLDSARKGVLLRFLHQAGLIHKDNCVIDLSAATAYWGDDYKAEQNPAELVGAELSRAILTRADLRNANLSGVNLSGADLVRAYLDGAILNLASLSMANLHRASMLNASLNMANLQEANLSWAILRGATLIQTQALGTDLSQADLVNVDLSGADLLGANLSQANLNGANLQWAINVTKANLDGITYDDNTKWPNDFTPPGTIKIESEKKS